MSECEMRVQREVPDIYMELVIGRGIPRVCIPLPIQRHSNVTF